MNYRFKVPRIYRKLFPELELIKDDEQQFYAFVEAWKHIWPTAIVLMALIAYALRTIHDSGIKIVKEVGEPFAQFILVLICLPLFVVIVFIIHGKQVRRAIRKKINENGTRICIECGCLLEGIDETLCPRCGFESTCSNL